MRESEGACVHTHILACMRTKVWAAHIVTLSGGLDSAPWGAGERLVSVAASWISLLGVGCLVHRAYSLVRLSDGICVCV